MISPAKVGDLNEYSNTFFFILLYVLSQFDKKIIIFENN